ncbi:uncharacterized protein TrAFT101_005718 [Trichoderma asperellum]|uniref:uncharacterized protein n=1 Tax=Trichoderma asperellum TaxID=101201 RepID=UPI00332CF982|nr:hypothetical protein TrAFT101_005718 [Trichoderma asperellum]
MTNTGCCSMSLCACWIQRRYSMYVLLGAVGACTTRGALHGTKDFNLAMAILPCRRRMQQRLEEHWADLRTDYMQCGYTTSDLGCSMFAMEVGHIRLLHPAQTLWRLY